MSNEEAVYEYRRALDAAQGVRLALGLVDVLEAGVASGELKPSVAVDVLQTLREVYKQAGSADPRKLERKAFLLREAIVRKNMRLVWKIARRTLGPRRSNLSNLEEAVSEGAIGLVRAIEEYDATRGTFTTCAGFWIRHHVQNCMFRQVDFAKQRSACMPPSVIRQVNKFRAQHGREPQPHEVTHKDKPCTQQQWFRWLDSAHVNSIDDIRERDEEGVNPPDELLADPEESPDNLVSTLQISARLDTAMSQMSPRNLEMSRMLFFEGKSLTEVSLHYGLSVERIRELKSLLEKRLREALVA
jgi:RNA polymerase sigma factor (sigma-70 family)